jgi:hypothetical protein
MIIHFLKFIFLERRKKLPETESFYPAAENLAVLIRKVSASCPAAFVLMLHLPRLDCFHFLRPLIKAKIVLQMLEGTEEVVIPFLKHS